MSLNYYVCFLVLFVVAICLITGALAARKGYSFVLWVFAGGIIGLVILAFLPFINKGDLSEIEVRERTKTGNIIGGVFTALAFIQIVPRLLVLMVAAATPKMSGTTINGVPVSQADWVACGHNAITYMNHYPSKYMRTQ